MHWMFFPFLESLITSESLILSLTKVPPTTQKKVFRFDLFFCEKVQLMWRCMVVVTSEINECIRNYEQTKSRCLCRQEVMCPIANGLTFFLYIKIGELITSPGNKCKIMVLTLLFSRSVRHGPQNYVPENMFDDSMRLVIWGHEHDCRITPESVADKSYFITQPGSSVATSLAPGEAIPKYTNVVYFLNRWRMLMLYLGMLGFYPFKDPNFNLRNYLSKR